VEDGSKGTTSRAPTRPTAAAGSRLSSLREWPLIVWNIKAVVITTGSRRSISFQLLFGEWSTKLTLMWDEYRRFGNKLVLVATNRVKTSPRHRLRKTRVALTLRVTMIAIGRIIIQASAIAVVIFS